MQMDINRVIKGLEACIKRDCRENACPYGNMSHGCLNALYSDALELLKAVPPDAREVWIGLNGAFHWEYTCGACGCGIMRNDRWKTKYCPECGKAVKWDDEA